MPERETRSTSIAVRVTPALKTALERLADGDDRKLAAYIERILRNHVALAQAGKKGGKRK